jgi:PEP-CTERM motif
MNPHNRTLIPRIGGRFAVLVAGLLFAVSGLADTIYNNFTGYSDYWFPFGNPNTATYGELFTSPNNADHNLVSFSFYMGTPTTSGNIITGAYIATWTGTMAGTLLYSAGPINYDNLGDEQITLNTGGLALTANTHYVMFLSVSNYYGQSTGEAYASQGTSIQGLNGFVFNNNAGDFNALFTTAWNGPLSPDWAVNLHFNAVPEPAAGSLMLLGMGLLGGIGVLRRKLF